MMPKVKLYWLWGEVSEMSMMKDSVYDVLSTSQEQCFAELLTVPSQHFCILYWNDHSLQKESLITFLNFFLFYKDG